MYGKRLREVCYVYSTVTLLAIGVSWLRPWLLWGEYEHHVEPDGSQAYWIATDHPQCGFLVLYRGALYTSSAPTFRAKRNDVEWGDDGCFRKHPVPLLPLAGLLLIYPAGHTFVAVLRKTRRRHEGLCKNCGYDLTGNLSGKCPECGILIRTQSPSAPPPSV
jgi:hypothetical protein